MTCARVVCEPQCLTAVMQLMVAGQANIDTLVGSQLEPGKLSAPKWLQALLTFIDVWGRTIKIAKWWRPERHVGIYIIL